MFLIVHQKG